MDERSFEILLYDITANTVSKIMELNRWNENMAMERFTQSKTYSLLEDEKTKVWQYNTSAIVNLFNGELQELSASPQAPSISKTLEFKVFCFEAYRAEKKLSGQNAMQLFKQYGVLEYLEKFYDVLHTTDREYIIEDIEEFISIRKDRLTP